MPVLLFLYNICFMILTIDLKIISDNEVRPEEIQGLAFFIYNKTISKVTGM
jgi:nitrous oxidase accessory protein NosD